MNLEVIAPIIEDIIKDTLSQKRYPFGFANYKGLGNKVSTGTLRNSVQVKVVNKPDHVSIIEIMMVEYANYVQSGRMSGKKGVPIQPLMEWIRARKIKGRNKKGRFITNTSLAFAIQTNIKKYGIRPSNFLDISFEKIMEDSRILEAIGDQTIEDLINAIEGI